MNTPGAQQLSPISVGPWSPSERWSFPKPPPASSAGSPPPTSADDPFADPGAAALRRVSASGASSASSDGGATTPSAVTCRTSASAELIKRPFVPTLADELAVRRGDAVHVLQSFDDGWAQVARAHSGETGLIPVDCLREAGEALPAFLAARRVSSCGGAVAL
ncbi:hypothetical protein DFH11DRAFT_220747 [Phellopilus nigrolimitatus]|nr:hypothetical protein DFH11DRAFT_220747 [Phellopilus nigrolimitatus]